MNTLENVENQLKHYLAKNAVFIYWSHQLETFDYLNIKDNVIYHIELGNLRRQLRSGVIKSIEAGEPLMIKGIMLHKFKVTFATAKCVPYVLLRKQGNLQHADITPYFFTSLNCRDTVLCYIT